ncbi:MAG: hypothetical protein U1E89_09360 [Burkholderiaceae bacterium]
MNGWRSWRARVVAALLVCAAAVHAAEPPLDVFTDEAWQTTLLGLSAPLPRRVREEQTLFEPRSGGVLSTQRVEMSFDEGGRLSVVALRREPRGERIHEHVWRYQHDAQGRIVRIDEDGSDRPALERRFDAQGRLVEEARGEGAVTARTRWRYDAAGREIERVETAAGREAVTRTRYRRNGSRERQFVDRGVLQSSDLRFDAQGRPTREVVHDLVERRTTTVHYPHPRRAVHTIVASGLSRDGPFRRQWVRTFEVRRPEELLQWPEPASPVLRAESFAGYESSTRTEFDAQGRPLRQLEQRGATLRCQTDFRYHACGLPASITTTRLDAPGACPETTQAVEYEVEVDERGRWTRHVIHAVDAGGQRMRMAEHRRQIEDR